MGDAQIGVYGLGTMGSALALNFAEQGISVAVTNRETDWIARFVDEAGTLAGTISASDNLEDFVSSIEPPRLILLMIPSGAPVDQMIERFRLLLSPGDTLIDAGNADFHDTRRRMADLGGTGLNYIGMGVSGGENGARSGPSMMVGGDVDIWERLRPVLEPVAADFQGDPCVAHVGPDGAGHFVKTVHNGIEYADMQIIAEIYALLRDGAGWDAPQVGQQFETWSDGPLSSFLVEATARVFRTIDPMSGKPMVDMIRDQAGQKGSGRWTVIEALKLGQSATVIEAALAARAWSSAKPVRLAAETQLPAQTDESVELSDPRVLAEAFFAARLIAHVQGFEILRAASAEYDWSLDLARIAGIWRAGCIIRSALLDDLVPILQETPERPVFLAPGLAGLLNPAVSALRQVVSTSTLAGLPVPALAAALGWYDSIRRGNGTANLIQAQRDVFGRHGFERTDRPGKTHADWA